MRIKYKNIFFSFSLSLVLISLSLFSEANFTSMYVFAKAAEGSSAVKPVDAIKPATDSKGATVISKNDLSEKELEIIKKEHFTYCKAFLDAEMGLRYFYRMQYNAKYKGGKAPTEDQLKAMRFELSLLMKDLGSSAKRYASKINMAQMAMLGMNEDEKSFFAKALSQILGTPAYAIDTGSLSGIAAGLTSVANSTADVGISTQADFAKAEQAEANMAKAGEVAAAGVVLGTTTILAGAAVVGGVVLTAGVTTTAGAFLAPVVLIGAMVGGAIEVLNAGIGFVDAITEKTTDNKDLQNISTAINILNVTSGAKKAELIKVAIETADATKDQWIPEILGETKKPSGPGKDGAEAVKKAFESIMAGDGGGGGGG